jgi:uncharacterized membrane protein
MNELGRLVRRRLISGLIVIAPLAVTLYVLWWLFRTVDGILGNSVYRIIGTEIPGLGLVLLLALLLGVGWLAEEAIGKQVAQLWHGVLDRIPVVSRLYSATRRIVGSVFGGEERRFFKEVVLFEYPSPGQWTLGFQTGGAPRALDDRVENGVTIFLPTSPNPVTGFLIIVPEDRVLRLPVTVEEGFTFILSAGAVPPTGPHGQEPKPPSAAPVIRSHEDGPGGADPGPGGARMDPESPRRAAGSSSDSHREDGA